MPFAAGGSTDVAARLVGDYLSRATGQQFYVENRAGANGVIGMDAAAKSDPDGYTVLVTAMRLPATRTSTRSATIR